MPPKDKKFVNPLLRSTESQTESDTDTPTKASTKESTQTPMQVSTLSPTETSTDTPTSSATDTSTETSMSTNTSANTYTSTDDEEDATVERRKRGKQAFDKIHMRWTLWINKKLKKRIDQLAKEKDLSLVAIAEEAFTDLLKKYGK